MFKTFILLTLLIIALVVIVVLSFFLYLAHKEIKNKHSKILLLRAIIEKGEHSNNNE